MRKSNVKKLAVGLSVAVCAAAILTGIYLGKRDAEERQEPVNGRPEYSGLYTWEEYQALSPEEQDAFYRTFASAESFEAWLEAVQPTEATEPEPIWNKTGKNPDEYTWEEYQALTSREQEAFFRWFGSVEAFEEWMEKGKPTENTEPVLSWDKSGKNPDEYTWEEYQALTSWEQEAFFRWFDSVATFEAWMEKAKPTENTEPVLSWDKSGKNPDEYTWEEYLALTPQEQDAFFLWFGSVEAFEGWMNAAVGAPD